MARYLTVVPVVDYEPAPVKSPVCAPRQSNSTAIYRSRIRRTMRTTSAMNDDRPAARAAAAFADVALRSVLEVVDGRRAMAQLRPLLAVDLIDTVHTLASAARTAPSRPAILRRVQLRIVDRDGQAAEVFATYTRGERVRAIAARVECGAVRGATRWRLVALQVG